MMFLFAVPVMEAFGVYLVPLMVGTRNIAFPRLNAFSYWLYLFGGCFLWIAFVLQEGPDVGWFAYVPLSLLQYTPTKQADVWAQMITFTEVAALAVAVEIITTVFKLRAPGMTLDRIPIFVWSMLVTSFLVVFAMPSIMVASTALILDRLVGTHFFDPVAGGNVLLWQHLFWFFGHPEVYIIFLPATGMVSTIIAVFSRRPVFGYPALVLSNRALLAFEDFRNVPLLNLQFDFQVRQIGHFAQAVAAVHHDRIDDVPLLGAFSIRIVPDKGALTVQLSSRHLALASSALAKSKSARAASMRSLRGPMTIRSYAFRSRSTRGRRF